MKPVISVIYDENENPIVVLSKNISGLDQYEKVKETRKFYTSEVKQLESMVEFLIIDKLNDYGIIPFDDSEESLQSAFQKLAENYKMRINIVDGYSDYKGKIVHRGLKQTCIEEDGELSIANKIMLEETKKC